MPYLCMRHDFRAPAFGPASTQRDLRGRARAVRVGRQQRLRPARALGAPRHRRRLAARAAHDGGGRARAHRSSARVMVSAAILPLHDPVRIAEQIAVLDNAAPGRLWVVVGAGYRVEEFEMAGPRARGARPDPRGVRRACCCRRGRASRSTGAGRTVTVTPKPATEPHPMLLVGGGVPAAARRAARLRLPMLPMNTDQVVRDAYFEEARAVGYKGASSSRPVGPTFVHVAEDPEQAWAEIGPYVLYEAQTYASYQTPGQHSTPGVQAETVDDLKASPQFVVGTPTRCGPGWNRFPATAASRSARSPAACRPTWPGRASSCSRPRSCRTCVAARSPGNAPLASGRILGVPSPDGSANSPQEVGDGPLPPFRHRRAGTDVDRPCDPARSKACGCAGPVCGRDERARARARRAARTGSTSGARCARRSLGARRVDAPHRRDRGARRVPRRAGDEAPRLSTPARSCGASTTRSSA